ncbi:diaminobutyrate--2-oxoglutarate transaminase [Candidatus Manganitrophus noduliformans]|uniref:Diaminobutyrate--2-oxoglutarate transaminase n=1 Tax=Candidatus Manganitrophus noduliformans TaxID=2606439 RepID=A0A7X6DL80_9BACT|nr:diaminobutyrate--2-oxoglutarate transaminase [Candidatus Manganitrophus noduliformans]NKE69260.1 diaminobutyrate--2-oxoglutarate transaminase [Candidatus Manganitrophus noduliformans]
MEITERIESRVRSYCHSFPAVFDKAEGCFMYDTQGREYVDFFSGAGALNYGHNPPHMKEKLLEYIERNGLTHSLDMVSTAKERLLGQFSSTILEPRGLEYKIQFPGPTGTNAVEAALKLARKITGRKKIISFTNAFHGMSLGSLSVTGNAFKRNGAGIPLMLSDTMPFCGYFGEELDTIDYMERFLSDTGSGVDLAAAVIVESVQAEGGINVAAFDWLQRLAELCRRHGMLLIFDEIQVGCGRTGPFFSFEPAGLEPDIVCLSKSISGYGLPMALTLIKPAWDQWEPGEHNGTFRGHNLAFITAAEALTYWKSDRFTEEIQKKGKAVHRRLQEIADQYSRVFQPPRGRGMIQGLPCSQAGLAKKITRTAFDRGLIMETAGPEDNVLKFMPPLIIDEETLTRGLEIAVESIEEVVGRAAPSSNTVALGSAAERRETI